MLSLTKIQVYSSLFLGIFLILCLLKPTTKNCSISETKLFMALYFSPPLDTTGCESAALRKYKMKFEDHKLFKGRAAVLI